MIRQTPLPGMLETEEEKLEHWIMDYLRWESMTTMSKISDVTGIPYKGVFETLDRLRERGLVEERRSGGSSFTV